MADITLPLEQRIDNRTEPFSLQEAPFVNQYYLGYMSKGLQWSVPTFLFVERFKAEYRASLPDADGWVVRAEAYNESDGFTSPFYLAPSNEVLYGEGEVSFEDVWKYKNAIRYRTLEEAVMVLNWTLDLWLQFPALPSSAAPIDKNTAL